mgnify:CR=1 FL=1
MQNADQRQKHNRLFFCRWHNWHIMWHPVHPGFPHLPPHSHRRSRSRFTSPNQDPRHPHLTSSSLPNQVCILLLPCNLFTDLSVIETWHFIFSAIDIQHNNIYYIIKGPSHKFSRFFHTKVL